MVYNGLLTMLIEKVKFDEVRFRCPLEIEQSGGNLWNFDPARTCIHNSANYWLIIPFHKYVSITFGLTTEVFAKLIVLLMYFLPFVY